MACIRGANTLDAATIVKLTRTLAIIPITLALAVWQMRVDRRAGGEGKSTFSLRRAFPTFVGLFVLASLATTVFSPAHGRHRAAEDALEVPHRVAMSATASTPTSSSSCERAAKPIALGAAVGSPSPA